MYLAFAVRRRGENDRPTVHIRFGKDESDTR